MKSTKKPKSKADNTAPLSSLATAVATDQTLSLLADAGLSAFRGSEAQALALLTGTGDEKEYAPICYGKEYDPNSPFCSGCVFMPTCWSFDKRYLKKAATGKAALPPHVPEDRVRAAFPKRSKRSPPVPKKRRQ